MPLIPFLTNTSPSAGLYVPASQGGGGGGGGGAGPNLTVSSITFNPNAAGSGILCPNGASTFQMTYAQILDEANSSQNTIAFLNNTPSPVLGLDVAVGGLYILGDGGSYSSAPSAHLNQTNGNLTIAAPTTGSVLMLSPTSISSLTVSSINGAVPGGGGGSVGPNLTVSTITFPSTLGALALAADGTGASVLNIQNGATGVLNDMRFFTNESANAFVTNFQPGGVANLIQTNAPGNGVCLNFGATDAGGGLLAVAIPTSGNPSTLTIASDNLSLIQPTAGAPLNIIASDTKLYSIEIPSVAGMSIGAVGGRNQVYMDVAEADDLMVSTITAVAGADITALKPLAVSSLVGVSSLNGNLPVYTSGSGQDIATLFKSLFEANPSLSTITF